MIPCFSSPDMRAEITANNQLTLPKSRMQAVGTTDDFHLQARDRQLTLKPVRIQRGDAVRAQWAELGLPEDEMAAAEAWARASAMASASAMEPAAAYDATSAQPKQAVARQSASQKVQPKT
jgi:hypothetical protein